MSLFIKQPTEYYLRVSVTDGAVTNQYHLFSKYDNDRRPQDVLTWMLAEVTRAYKLNSARILVEQFSKVWEATNDYHETYCNKDNY